jgi:hypothetical protein
MDEKNYKRFVSKQMVGFVLGFFEKTFFFLRNNNNCGELFLLLRRNDWLTSRDPRLGLGNGSCGNTHITIKCPRTFQIWQMATFAFK